MTGIPSYSTSPAENVQANTGINWDEGMPPAAVNNSARANMTDLRLQWNDAPWFQYGTGSKTTVIPVYVSGTSFKVAGVDVTAYWHVGRRVRAVGTGTGTIYGIITASAFSTDTTLTVQWSSGSLSNEALTISAGLPITGSPAGNGAQTWTPADGSGAALSFSSVSGGYTRNGNLVTVYCKLTFPVTADGSAAIISGLPFPIANQDYASGCAGYLQPSTYVGGIVNARAVKNSSTIALFITSIGGGSIVAAPNSQFSNVTINFSLTYPIA